ncbi:hypothetical protein KZZ20_10905 [Methylacidiphilum fumariolicum]|uniref:hypothetical protein n=1 Tax=Candidatus Methylacidiphilum fumarolicum TaxID=591154 RepID=UPI00106BCBFA|nr:hypothetical protein [Candidatus Methylacidiphilum fumarolicum]MBW6416012.1 hypothetical protein [Candidatus Methylacidiphilum fumarolicum]
MIDDWLRSLSGSTIHRNKFQRNLSVGLQLHPAESGYKDKHCQNADLAPETFFSGRDGPVSLGMLEIGPGHRSHAFDRSFAGLRDAEMRLD